MREMLKARNLQKKLIFWTFGSIRVRLALQFWKRATILRFPADVYFEGGDQYRGWFNSSLMCGLAAHDTAPYKTVLTHGWVVDGEGKKQSKSVGNVTAPQEIIDKSGAEILRMWAAAVDYTEDVRCSDEILSRVIDAYRKFRNTLRYALGNLDGFNPETESVAFRKCSRSTVGRWRVLDDVTEKVLNGYETYDFQAVYQTVYNFVTVTLSARYFDIIKDRLYICAPNSMERRSAQTALFKITDNLCRLLAPILVFYGGRSVGKFAESKVCIGSSGGISKSFRRGRFKAKCRLGTNFLDPRCCFERTRNRTNRKGRSVHLCRQK